MDGDVDCHLCGRPLGKRVERHHALPRSRGGRVTIPLHPICHRAIHTAISNAELARAYATAEALKAHPELARFIAWVADKPPDFHAPTRKPRGRR